MPSSYVRVISAACLAPTLACGSTRVSPAAPTTTTTTSVTNTSAACAVTGTDNPTPVTDPNGPYFHQVVIARTSDGLRLRDARLVLEHASVPDGVQTADGSLRIYYVNGAEGVVWVARSNGTTVTPIGPISINGIARPRGVVDPDATRLPDGRIRLTYLSGFGAPGSSSPRAMCIADSADGERFTLVGAALTFGSIDLSTDPSIVPLSSGGWLMAISRGQQTTLARSSNGTTFFEGETLPYGGVPELAALPDGRVRLYVCARGLESYVSADEGRSWTREGSVSADPGAPAIVCDPSVVAGTDVFVYKTIR